MTSACTCRGVTLLHAFGLLCTVITSWFEDSSHLKSDETHKYTVWDKMQSLTVKYGGSCTDHYAFDGESHIGEILSFMS
jgi:hypothetical protein